MTDVAYQICISPQCQERYAIDDAVFECTKCGSLLDVAYDWSRVDVPKSLSLFTSRLGNPVSHADARVNSSGVWRFRELLPFARPEDLVTLGEGNTLCQRSDGLASHVGIQVGHLFLQYEGFNPSGSFKDNGMAAASTMARLLGRRRVACASTGNTSASMALFCGKTSTSYGEPMEAVVFVGSEKIALGKLAQALDYGARTLQVEGDFDECMRLVQASAKKLGLYLMNSVNPFRLEGQKTVMYRVLEALGWEVPDWIVVPGGNLGNSSAFGKAFAELAELGLIDRVPRLAIINAQGADTLAKLVNERGLKYSGGVDTSAIDAFYSERRKQGWRANTVASAIEIGTPVNLHKALRSLDTMSGVVRAVADEEILDAKALVGRFGFGCEPASAAAVAGLKLLLREGVVSPSERVVCILTGHALKDTQATMAYHDQRRAAVAGREYANRPVLVKPDLDVIAAALGETH